MSIAPSNVVAFQRTDAFSSDVQSELSAIEHVIAPCDVNEAMLALKPLFVLPIPKDADERTFVASFRFVVEGYPLWLIKETTGAFIGGRVTAHQSSYCPNTAEFGRELERRISAVRDRVSRARRNADEARKFSSEPARTPRSPAMKAMGDAAVARLRAAADAERQKLQGIAGLRVPVPQSLPLTEEDLIDVPLAPVQKGTTPVGTGFKPFQPEARTAEHG